MNAVFKKNVYIVEIICDVTSFVLACLLSFSLVHTLKKCGTRASYIEQHFNTEIEEQIIYFYSTFSVYSRPPGDRSCILINRFSK